MVNALIRTAVKFLLWLRYRIDVSGLGDIQRRGTRGILFLPSHPALIDPFIVLSVLNWRFHPKVIADSEAIDYPVVRPLAIKFGTYPIPSMAKDGIEARRHIEDALHRCADGLRHGENWILYPAGHILTGNRENLGANSAVETLLQEAPGTRVVLLRTRGLWGSGFSRAADGRPPAVGAHLRKGIWRVLANFIVFTPRRRVTMTFAEPNDLPRTAGRQEINRYLEHFFNREPLPRNTYVPYTIWERMGTHERPEPATQRLTGNVAAIPSATREIVLSHLQEISGRREIADDDQLAGDLGLDSLLRAELMVWLESEFGFPQGHADSLLTVGDVLLAAVGEAFESTQRELPPPPAAWSTGLQGSNRIVPPVGRNLVEAFLNQARRMPDTVIVADQTGGLRTYRDVVMGILALLPALQRLPGDYLGIMLPASVAVDTLYLAALFAGKVPVMVNWTVGARNMRHSLDLIGVDRVLTARQLLMRLQQQGNDLGDIADRFIALEDVAAKLSRARKLHAWLGSRLRWTPLQRAHIADTAVVLFTSGSENLPKAVPLTHDNLLANMRDVLQVVEIRESDRMLGMLPPFHSFGLTVNIAFALCAGVRTVYHPNPTESTALARVIEMYGATLFIGTPTFAQGIARVAAPEQLRSLRLLVTGAEECPPRVYQALADSCPSAVIIEGYGITECSPIVSVNDPQAPRPITIGHLLPSFEAAIVNLDTGRRVSNGETGMLLLRGPSIFPGYLGPNAPNPFVDFDGKSWYRTGDLVCQDADGVLTFKGRLKRFVKIGGEMISLPAIESVLLETVSVPEAEGPVIAVVASASVDRPELILCAAIPIDRDTANRLIRDAGLSPLHNIRQVVQLTEIPILGTGKTDYRCLQQVVDEAIRQPS